MDDTADFEDAFETDDVAASWQPIYVSVVLTTAQAVFFFLVFECSRRSDFVGHVYERRRQKNSPFERRTPPPLMRRRGCLSGWLAFEWWRIKVADPDYLQQSEQEYERRLKAKKERQEARRFKRLLVSSATSDEAIILAAERSCFRESPFFDPTVEDDNNGNDPELEGGAATAESEDRKQDDDVTEPTAVGIDTVDTGCCSNAQMDAIVLDELKQEQEIPIEESGIAPSDLEKADPFGDVKDKAILDLPPPNQWSLRQPLSILRSRSTVSMPLDQAAPIGSSPKNPLSSSERSHSRGGVPFTIGGSERDSDRKVRFGSGNCAASTKDAVVGSQESERLGRLRFDSEEIPDWDARTVSSISSAMSKFLRNRILMLHADGEGEAAAMPPGAHERVQRQFAGEKVQRRPLSCDEEELLRCVGLDAFMTLRFLIFGFDVSFWPLMFSLITLIPIFKTGKEDVVGFFSTTVISLEDKSPRHWMVVIFGFVQFTYILRRLWIEWEIFLPLRYDFLENGDFQTQKYKEQYRKTCLVEYVDYSHRHGKDLYTFFDTIFPGQVQRAEVLLNTEYLRSLITERLQHIMNYEDAFAKKVHKTANYLREMEAIEKGGVLKTCCGTRRPRKPKEPRITVIHDVPREDLGNAFFQSDKNSVRDPRTYETIKWHHRNIQRLNKEIEDEYIRLAQAKRRKVQQRKESPLSKWLGLKYLTGSDTGRLHSSTAFVEFKTLIAKQQAISCNVTGKNHYIEIKPVPEIREIFWQNAHVSRSLIETRKAWVNLLLTGCLVLWSFLVFQIRAIDDLSDWLKIEQPFIVVFLDIYVPALVVEGLVRIIPLVIRGLCYWVRFKTLSEIDHYVLRWYFGYRFFTFLFVIIGGSLTASGEDFIDDPIKFVKNLSENVVEQAEFFISYVVVSGGIQIFFRLSQLHNVLTWWFVHNVVQEEAVSQRRLEKMRTSIKTFHLDEFIPLFLFIWMVSALYGALAPLSLFFVAFFFKCAYKVFKYMTLYVYGNHYEGGGFLFYTLTSILFYVLYLMIIMVAGYLSIRGSGAMASIFSLLLIITSAVHVSVHRTFVIPSKTLSLAKARISDESNDPRTTKQRKLEAYLKAKAAFEEMAQEDGPTTETLTRKLLPASDVSTVDDDNYPSSDVNESSDNSANDADRRRTAMQKLERKYREEETFSEVTESDASGSRPDFFIYRQPSLNRATWEVSPRSYHRNAEKPRTDFQFW